MEKTYFYTGFPGFISNQLIREALKQVPTIEKTYVLVLPNQADKAKAEIIRIKADYPKADIEIVEGDITKEKLGIEENQLTQLKQSITHVFHLAAIYDLAVPEKIAELVNVDGTRNVNNFVRTLTKLERYIYFSTAYIAGTREGILYEGELIRPASFKNHYERTKYDAEVLVEALKKDVPTTIIRPGIVKGHSKTGETIKFDGPYFILNFLDRLSFLPFYPQLAPRDNGYVNLVPVDYIIQSTVYLSLHKDGEGITYHLTDPNPCRASEIYELFVKELYNKTPKGRIPMGVSRALLGIKPVRTFLKVEKEALDYFTWKGVFDCSLAQLHLQGSGIACPPFRDGVSAMVDFYQQHKREKNYQIDIL